MPLSLLRGRVGSSLRRVRERKVGAPLVTEEALAKAQPGAPIRKSIKEPIERQVGRGSSKFVRTSPLIDFSSPQGLQVQPTSTRSVSGGFVAAPPKPSIVGSTKAAPSKGVGVSRAQGVQVRASLSIPGGKPKTRSVPSGRQPFGPRTLGGAPILRTAASGAASRVSTAFLRSLRSVSRKGLGFLSGLVGLSPMSRLQQMFRRPGGGRRVKL